jgi:ectoine hydroxylase-related dioxygenase (phytanoyl-CoA dioxygenase family)
MAVLKSDQSRFYQENGYYLYKDQLFSEAKLSRLTSIFEEHLAGKGDKLSDQLDSPHFRDARLLDFLLADEVLDLVEPLIGPNIALWASHFICKDPFTGRATPWHEDSGYWSENNRLSRYDKIVTVWLAIDRSMQENGCMGVIPGTHTNGFSEYEAVDRSQNTFGRQIKDIDDSKAVYFELERGQCSLHDARIIHGAKANTSPHRRCGYTMRYFSADTKLNEGKNPKGFKIWLARGKDLAGNVYANV